ncbi:hypothetical protein AB0B45_27445 [Nonomuraea sp. NPDC049152]|uniref:hypothetical protein n=1 Tax=Nonomuraea sp. NPDC049152 TaxID=3154350 RepID=UPI0033FC9817
MLVVLAIAALAILACVVVVSLGRGGELTAFPPDVPPLDLPEAGQLTAVDFMALQLPVNLVGYHTQSVDETLRRAANAISARDTRIAVLEQRVSELLASRLQARQEAYAGPGAAPRTDHRPEAPTIALPEDGEDGSPFTEHENASPATAHQGGRSASPLAAREDDENASEDGISVIRFDDYEEGDDAFPLAHHEADASAARSDGLASDVSHSRLPSTDPIAAASAAGARQDRLVTAPDPNAKPERMAAAADPSPTEAEPHSIIAPAEPNGTAAERDLNAAAAAAPHGTGAGPNRHTTGADPNAAASGSARVGHQPTTDAAEANQLRVEKSTSEGFDEPQDETAAPGSIDQSWGGAVAPDGMGRSWDETTPEENELGHADSTAEEVDQVRDRKAESEEIDGSRDEAESGRIRRSWGDVEPDEIGRSWGHIGSPAGSRPRQGGAADSEQDRTPGNHGAAGGLPASIGQDREGRS